MRAIGYSHCLMSFLFSHKGDRGMTRTLQSELIKKGLTKKSERKSVKPKEKLSKQDIEELMGIRRPRYHRVKGSYRSH